MTIGSQRVRHDLATAQEQTIFICILSPKVLAMLFFSNIFFIDVKIHKI